ncbi:uncharacterized protein LOC102406900 isoform X3 [Bubalus bubalis]|uniref:uncharacterized protein LOC102406900 isoform X3 n=1 Tax=Bubalus bubalis TaxID=89462 RepID=UPI001D110FEB|nr:uncharacterized protein LOC102406900 isoform X3 [Bubalus bubalis]XP_025127492.2 uncharacterized protein LOC102406900 isoform X3 [Bubalus bubalis]
MIPEAMLPNCQGYPHLFQISSSFLGNGIEKSNLPGCCECWSDSGKLVRPGIEEAVSKSDSGKLVRPGIEKAVSKCFFQTGWSTTFPSPPSPVSRFSFILPQRSGQPQSAGLSVYQVCPPKRCVPASPRLGARASPGPVARLGLLPGLLLPTPLPILAAPTSHLPPLKTRRQEPRRPRIVNAWTEEVEELPWSSTSSGGSPGVSRLPRAVMLPGLGRSHHLESSVVQDLEPATPAPSSSIIPPQPQGTPARVPTGQAGPKDSGPGPTPLCRGACPPRLPSL